MNDEVFVLALLSVAMGASVIIALAWMILSFFKSRSGKKDGPTMTTSELQRIVEQAVTKAVVPLSDRLESLEDRLDGVTGARMLPPPEEEALAFEPEQPREPARKQEQAPQ